MNTIIAKQASVLALILGAILGFLALISPLMIYIVPAISFLCAPLVIIYMKRRKMLGYLDNQQGTTLGAIIGAGASLGFFAVFVPSVLIIGAIFKKYYTYGIPYFFNFQSFWLLIIILLMLAATIATTNAVAGMGTIFVYNQIEPKPKETDEGQVDIKVE